MGSIWVRQLTMAAVLIAVAAGCGRDEPTGGPTTSEFMKERELLAARQAAGAGKKSGVRAENAGDPTQEMAANGSEGSASGYASASSGYFYDPRGKRDPFRSYRFVSDEEGENSERSFGPLADFEIGQLELSAVIWHASNPRALIRDPGGRSYIVREGSPIGKNSGQVIHIGDNLVLVKETYENYAGERTTKDVELRIRLSQGG